MQAYLGAQVPDVAGVVLHSPLLSGIRVLSPGLRWWPSFADVYPNHLMVPKIESPTLILHVRRWGAVRGRTVKQAGIRGPSTPEIHVATSPSLPWQGTEDEVIHTLAPPSPSLPPLAGHRGRGHPRVLRPAAARAVQEPGGATLGRGLQPPGGIRGTGGAQVWGVWPGHTAVHPLICPPSPHLPPPPSSHSPPHLSPTFLQNLEMCPEYLPVLESFVAAATSALDAAPPREEEAEDGAAPTAHIGCLGVGCLGASASASPLPPRLPPR